MKIRADIIAGKIKNIPTVSALTDDWPRMSDISPLGETALLRTEVQRASIVALRRLVFRRLVRVAPVVQPGLDHLGLSCRHAQPLRDVRRVLQRVALGDAFVLETAQMECLVGQRVRRPAGAELRETAVAALEAAEVDTVEMPECLARLR